jgi:hypothetical protein
MRKCMHDYQKFLVSNFCCLSKLQSYKVTKLQSYKVTKLQSYKVTKLQSYKVTKLQSYNVAKLQTYKVTKLYSLASILNQSFKKRTGFGLVLSQTKSHLVFSHGNQTKSKPFYYFNIKTKPN